MFDISLYCPHIRVWYNVTSANILKYHDSQMTAIKHFVWCSNFDSVTSIKNEIELQKITVNLQYNVSTSNIHFV